MKELVYQIKATINGKEKTYTVPFHSNLQKLNTNTEGFNSYVTIKLHVEDVEVKSIEPQLVNIQDISKTVCSNTNIVLYSDLAHKFVNKNGDANYIIDEEILKQ